MEIDLVVLIALCTPVVLYGMFQIKQSLVLSRSLEVLLKHVEESRTHNGRALDHQVLMRAKTDHFEKEVDDISKAAAAIVSGQKQQEMMWQIVKEMMQDMRVTVSNNTEAMTNIRVALNSKACMVSDGNHN